MSAAPNVVLFVAGVMSAGHAIAGLFFLRFWVRTRDRLFAAFAIAFWLMALNQAVAGFMRHAHAENSPAYLLRLLAFVLIIVAILDKNGRPDTAVEASSKKQAKPP
jgi:membrane-associated PAP2 superfamily phosphatase